jgi:hypothetical protein
MKAWRMIVNVVLNQEPDTMSTRRNFITATALLGSAVALEPALAQAPKKGAKQADFLFVQNAKSMSYDKAQGKLTLQGVSPVTVFFTDRPERIAGNMATSAFVPFWSDGKDSFSKDAPNANLSIMEPNRMVADIVVVLKNPALQGEDLSYDVSILQGEMPATGGPVALFIDVIGMPLTPLSYAGVARRTAYRRAVYWRR